MTEIRHITVWTVYGRWNLHWWANSLHVPCNATPRRLSVEAPGVDQAASCRSESTGPSVPWVGVPLEPNELDLQAAGLPRRRSYIEVVNPACSPGAMA